MDWDLVPGATYRLYRGTRSRGQALRVLPLECLARNLPGPAGVEDPTPPPPGGILLYLVAAENACGVSPFGPADVPRPSPPACP
jgi:hypothetical protein